nr:MAG TPA: hypothetical protein [Caudoviricetes sp.]
MSLLAITALGLGFIGRRVTLRKFLIKPTVDYPYST